MLGFGQSAMLRMESKTETVVMSFRPELGKSDNVSLFGPISRMFGSAHCCDCSSNDASCGRRCSNMPSRVADTCLVLKVGHHPANLAKPTEYG
jgi:hypothetical protein